MLSFAWNGISSLSIKPLRFVTFCGFVIFAITILLSIYALVAYMTHHTATGWASTVIPMYFLGGIQLLCIGLIGEYVAKMYKEVKHRPRFIIEEHLQ
jgi:glycosyltransferase involved in cell wall biosynthesis